MLLVNRQRHSVAGTGGDDYRTIGLLSEINNPMSGNHAMSLKLKKCLAAYLHFSSLDFAISSNFYRRFVRKKKREHVFRPWLRFRFLFIYLQVFMFYFIDLFIDRVLCESD